jgi:N-acetylmuramoyl-L-alanine amidase
MQSRLFLMFLFCCAVISLSLAQKNEIVVVIDPGHGGYDPGHLSDSPFLQTEKALNLKIALFLGGYIEKYLQNVKVVYTRTTDVYPTLDERVVKANSINADYFISIHCNGNERKTIHGTESHVHSMSLSKSVKLANEIEVQFSQRAGRKSRGVKDEKDLQHSLQVLKHTNMTGVLVECGFLTNEKEAEYLNTTDGQEVIASAIFRGFRSVIVKEYPSISFLRSVLNTTTTASEVADASTNSAFTIQIASSRDPIDPKDARFNSLKMDVNRVELQTTSAYKYIYTVGSYASKSDAKSELPQIQSHGYNDAIVIKL